MIFDGPQTVRENFKRARRSPTPANITHRTKPRNYGSFKLFSRIVNIDRLPCRANFQTDCAGSIPVARSITRPGVYGACDAFQPAHSCPWSDRRAPRVPNGFVPSVAGPNRLPEKCRGREAKAHPRPRKAESSHWGARDHSNRKKEGEPNTDRPRGGRTKRQRPSSADPPCPRRLTVG
jgi:hypothetical protein